MPGSKQKVLKCFTPLEPFSFFLHFSPFILIASFHYVLQVFLKKGPYGYYVQLGDDKKGYTPKRASVSEVC